MDENADVLKILKFFLTTLIVIPNFVGNALVCVVVKRNKAYHTFVNFLLVHLAVIDIITGVSNFIEVFIETYFPDKSSINSVVCRLFSNHTVVLLGAFTSALTIITVSVHRYLGIVKPLRSIEYSDVRNLKFIIPLTWLVSLAGTFPRFRKSFSSPECIDLGNKYAVGGVNYAGNFLGLLLGFLMPVGILGYLVWKISRALKTRWRPLTMNSTGQETIFKSRKKAIRRLSYVILAFSLSVLPYQVVSFLKGMFNIQESFWGGFADVISQCIFIAGSSINPFLYWVHDQKFRRSALRLFGKSKQVGPMPMSHQNSSSNNNIVRTRRITVRAPATTTATTTF